jgi:hypothetical protein
MPGMLSAFGWVSLPLCVPQCLLQRYPRLAQVFGQRTLNGYISVRIKQSPLGPVAVGLGGAATGRGSRGSKGSHGSRGSKGGQPQHTTPAHDRVQSLVLQSPHHQHHHASGGGSPPNANHQRKPTTTNGPTMLAPVGNYFVTTLPTTSSAGSPPPPAPAHSVSSYSSLTLSFGYITRLVLYDLNDSFDLRQL